VASISVHIPRCLRSRYAFCFEAAKTGYTPTPQCREFFGRYCAGRPLAIALLQQAWAACQRNEAMHERNEMLGVKQQAETQASSTKELNALDDQSVDRLYHDNLQQCAKTVKRGPGILA